MAITLIDHLARRHDHPAELRFRFIRELMLQGSHRGVHKLQRQCCRVFCPQLNRGQRAYPWESLGHLLISLNIITQQGLILV